MSSEKSRTIYQRYINGETFEEISKDYMVTRERIRQIVEKEELEQHPLRKSMAQISYVRSNLSEAALSMIGLVDDETLCRYNALVKEFDNLHKKLADIDKGGESDVFYDDDSVFMNVHINEVRKEGLLSTKVCNCLLRSNINTTKDLTYVTYSQIRNIRNLGNKGYDEVILFCEKKGISIGSNKDNIPEFEKGDHVETVVNIPRAGYIKGITMTVTGLDEGGFPVLPRYKCSLDNEESEWDWLRCSAGMMEKI